LLFAVQLRHDMAELTSARTPVAETLQNLLVSSLFSTNSAGLQKQESATCIAEGSIWIAITHHDCVLQRAPRRSLGRSPAPQAVKLLRTVRTGHLRGRYTWL